MPHTEIVHHYKRKEFQIAIAFLIIFYSALTLCLSNAKSYELLPNIMPLSLLLTIGIIQQFHKEWDINYILSCFGTFTIIFLTYALSTETQKLLGPITFGNSLGWKIWNTPAIIGIFWLIPIYCIYGTLEFFNISDFIKSFLGGVLFVSFDIFIEPVASQIGMWTWSLDDVPSQNYLVWFVLSFIIFSALHYLKIKIHNPLAMPLLVLMFSVFVILSLVL